MGNTDYRLVSLVQTTELTNSVTDEVSSPPVNAVWVVARIDVVPRQTDPEQYCSFDLLGPQRRTWKADSGAVSRAGNSYCEGTKMAVGRTWPLEVIFQIPERYVDQLAGVAVGSNTRDARQVLVPPR